MTTCVTAAITLTIPDNEARTAYTTLRRLGVEIGQLERCELLLVQNADDAAVDGAVRRNESVFNENTHLVTVRRSLGPEAGELWICDDRPAQIHLEGVGAAVRLRGYRLRSASGEPAPAETIDHAATLLCNPAVQRRIGDVAELFAGETVTR